MRKKIFLSVLISLVMAAGAFFAAFNAEHNRRAEASASAEIAMELQTGTVLCGNNADIKLPMASTTKIMTAIVIIEDCNLDETFIVPEKAVGVEGSSIYLKKDERISVKDLLYGLMLRSGNDAATALAIHHSGSTEKFAEVMTERAEQYGARNTNFKNPSGLPDDEHYTTARDLCTIACHAMRNSVFKEIVSTKNYKGEFRDYVNKNKLLYNFDGANGIKTGYTMKAGRCLVSSAEREGMDVVCVVLNCPDMYERSAELLNTCFKDYKLLNIDENAVFMSDKVLCKPLKSSYFVVKNANKTSFKVVPVENLKKIAQGDFVAKLEIYGENGLIFSENLYSIVDRNN